MTIRRHLLLLVCACFFPLLALCGLIVCQLAQSEADAFDRQLLTTAQALSTAMDTEVTATLKIAETLAHSRSLSADMDLPALWERAVEITRSRGTTVSLSDRERQLMNSRFPLGTVLPSPGLPWTQAIETGRPQVSDLCEDPTTAKPITVLSAPVFVDGRPRLAVSIVLGSAWVSNLLRKQKLPDGWRASVIDRKGTVVARSIVPEIYVGQQVTADFLPKILAHEQGVFSSRTLDGVDVRAAFTPTEAGWTVSLAVDRQVLEAPLRRSLLLIALGAGALLATAGAGAFCLSYRLSSATNILTKAAIALGRGEILPAPGDLVYREAGQVYEAQQTAAERLADRARERDRAEAELRDLTVTLESRVAARTSELFLANESLVEARKRAEAASRAKSEFLANMSHELRTPLNAVIGFSEFMEHEYLGPLGNPKYRSYAGDIRASGQHLLGLINEILDHAGAESGHLPLQEEEFDPSGLIEFAVRMLQTRAERVGIELCSVAATARWRLMADQRRLKQIVINLLTNAIKFTPSGGRVSVAIIEGLDGSLGFRVSDTGVGIAAEHIETALQPFGRVPGREAVEGTGLGLPLTKRLVELHGGRLQLESTVDAGTTVTAWLPPTRVRMRAAAPAGEGRAEVERFASRRTVILIVDNDPQVRGAAASLAEDLGYMVVTARTADDALALLRTSPIDLLFTDLVLPPGMNGVELAERAVTLRPGLRVLLTTASARSDITYGALLESIPTLVKPYGLKELRRALETALNTTLGPASNVTPFPVRPAPAMLTA